MKQFRTSCERVIEDDRCQHQPKHMAIGRHDGCCSSEAIREGPIAWALELLFKVRVRLGAIRTPLHTFQVAIPG